MLVVVVAIEATEDVVVAMAATGVVVVTVVAEPCCSSLVCESVIREAYNKHCFLPIKYQR